MLKNKGKYDLLMRPISLLIDLVVLLIVLSFYSGNIQDPTRYRTYIAFSWIILAYFSRFYSIYRYTKPAKKNTSTIFYIYLNAFIVF